MDNKYIEYARMVDAFSKAMAIPQEHQTFYGGTTKSQQVKRKIREKRNKK